MVVPVSVGDVLAERGNTRSSASSVKAGWAWSSPPRHLLLGERVAIKFLRPQARERADLVARFLREGQVAARIRSEHVTRVYDVGTLARGEPSPRHGVPRGDRPQGASLRDRGPLPVALACDYLLQACDALAEAHALGIVHRDLKPGNLFLTQRADGSPLIKVIDFGISKMALAAGRPAPKAHDMTESSTMLGSPFYMAPEQMVSSKSVDARADVWSMGAMLYQLLTGAVPFRGDSAMAIYDRILEGPPRLDAQRSDVPERLGWVVQRCLQKSPADRFGNIAELAAELARFAPPHAQHLADRAARVPQESASTRAPRRAVRPGRPAARTPRRLGPPAGRRRPATRMGRAWRPAPRGLRRPRRSSRTARRRIAPGAARAPRRARAAGRAPLGIAAALAAALVGAAGLAWLVWFALRVPASGGGAPLAASAPSEAPLAPGTLARRGGARGRSGCGQGGRAPRRRPCAAA